MSRIFCWKFDIYLAEIIFLLFQTWMEAECTGGAEHMKALHKMLFNEYDPTVRPSHNYGNPTVVSVQLHVINVFGLDEEKERMYMRAHFEIMWTDEYLQWNPANFSGIDTILMPQSRVWRPDIIRNSANDHDTLGSEDLLVSVTSEGRVCWDPPFSLEAGCKLDLSLYPYDVNVCPVYAYSWMSNNNTVRLEWPETPVELTFMVPSGEFKISSDGARRSFMRRVNRTFENLQFRIKLQRRPLYIVVSVMLPINLLAILTVVPFFMPPEESAKVDMSMVVLLSFTVFLDVMDKKIPQKSDKGNILVVYISLLLVLSFLSVVGNVIVVTVRNIDEATDKKAAQSSNFGNSAEKNSTEENITNIFSSGATCDLPERDIIISSSSSDLTKTLVRKKQKCHQSFHATRAAKLNKAFLVFACITLILISVIIHTLFHA